MTESAIVTAVCQYLDYKGHFFYRSNTVGVYDSKAQAYRRFPKYCRRGVPDIILVKNGKYIGLEVKTDKGKASEEQTRFAQDLLDAGGSYYIIRSIDDCEKIGL